jgi:predicted PurR-regulated permease PerM
MNIERFKTITFFIVLILLLVICFYLIKPFLYIIAWSIILTIIAYPLYKRLLKNISNPSLCAFLTLILMVGIVVIPLIFVFAYVLREGVTFVNYLASHVSELNLSKYTELITIPVIGNLNNALKDYANFLDINIEFVLKEKLKFLGSVLIQQSINFLHNMVTGVVQLVIVLLTFYFLLRDFPKLLSLIKAFVPLDESQTIALINKVSETIYVTVYVALIVAITQGTLGGLAFWILGLKSPLLWGIVMTVFCLIPLVGHPVVWVPAAIFLLFQGLCWKAILLVLWGMLVIGLVDNLIRTILIGAKTQLHPLVIFFSVLGAVILIGPLGILFGPVLIVITSFLLEVLKLKLSNK